MEFDLEQEKSCWILRQLHLKCNTVYHPKSNEMSSPKRTGDSYFGIVRKLLGRLWHYFNMLKWFEKDYTYHAEIAKELKQRNDEIYSTVMVSSQHDITAEIVWPSNILLQCSILMSR